MRGLVVFYLTCLILNVTLFVAWISPATARIQDQDCLPAISTPEATPQPQPESVVINEVITSPVRDQLYNPLSSGTPPKGPWIELYNTLAQPCQLTKASLDNGPMTNPFLITTTSISAHGFIVVFPFSNAKFSTTYGSELRLTLSGIPLDVIESIPELQQDESYARIPDGSLEKTAWRATANATMGKSNNVVVATATAPTSKKSVSKTKAPKKSTTTKGSSSQTTNQTQTSSSSASSSSLATAQAATAKAKVTQLQPNWKVVRLPTRIATSISTEQPTTPNLATIVTGSSPPDTLKKIAISLLVIALASTLWWCRKLFFKT